ncbi:universal stress protein PHOS34-like [Mangifera indica]|uniref:universal stress protein PHOS34-like n=1 Tax=Mangifera indica TaxID=29780 RepID=UPI001CFA53C2|nr:universal stress protein PHOS34-like [Mangifera indica]
MGDTAKPLMMVAVDNSNHSFYALEWALDNFFAKVGSNHLFRLIVIHARPSPNALFGFGGPGTTSTDVISLMDADAKKAAQKVIERVKDACGRRSVSNVPVQSMEGDPRDVITEAVDKHHADILVLGSHGYGAVKRAVLGSVSDYCAHHCSCSIMIVKKPKS